MARERSNHVETKVKGSMVKEGDKNTRFFHIKASQRQKRIPIKGVNDSNNVWHMGEERDRLIPDYF